MYYIFVCKIQLFIVFDYLCILYAEDTGLNERVAGRISNGETYWAVRQYWSLPKYIQHTQLYRNIMFEPLSGALHDMDRAMYWICKEAAVDLDATVRSLHSVKIWLKVNAQYESANPEAPNYKSFKSELGRSSTTVKEYPLNVIN